MGGCGYEEGMLSSQRLEQSKSGAAGVHEQRQFMGVCWFAAGSKATLCVLQELGVQHSCCWWQMLKGCLALPFVRQLFIMFQ
jgi:hypothetical protein